MNKLVKRGFGVYKIFLKNKLVSSIMMLFSGVMMFIAAINGHGNDTKSLPVLITSVGVILTLWTIYRFGYMKANYDRIEENKDEERKAGLKVLLAQMGEALVYAAVAAVGVFLLLNENVVDKVLNLMAGFFTTLNGVLGLINAYKKRENKDFHWKMLLVLTIVELLIGPFFIICSDSIEIGWYIVMGIITTIAGSIEVISALTRENLKCTLDDGKKIVKIIKDDEK